MSQETTTDNTELRDSLSRLVEADDVDIEALRDSLRRLVEEPVEMQLVQAITEVLNLARACGLDFTNYSNAMAKELSDAMTDEVEGMREQLRRLAAAPISERVQ